MNIYLAGPSGEGAKEAYDRVKKTLQNAGHRVIVPAGRFGEGHTTAERIREAAKSLTYTDIYGKPLLGAIVALEGWETCEVACWEVATARMIGVQMFEESAVGRLL